MELSDEQKWRVSQAFIKLLDPAILSEVARLSTGQIDRPAAEYILGLVGLDMEDYDAFYHYLESYSEVMQIHWGWRRPIEPSADYNPPLAGPAGQGSVEPPADSNPPLADPAGQ